MAEGYDSGDNRSTNASVPTSRVSNIESRVNAAIVRWRELRGLSPEDPSLIPGYDSKFINKHKGISKPKHKEIYTLVECRVKDYRVRALWVWF